MSAYAWARAKGITQMCEATKITEDSTNKLMRLIRQIFLDMDPKDFCWVAQITEKTLTEALNERNGRGMHLKWLLAAKKHPKYVDILQEVFLEDTGKIIVDKPELSREEESQIATDIIRDHKLEPLLQEAKKRKIEEKTNQLFLELR